MDITRAPRQSGEGTWTVASGYSRSCSRLWPRVACSGPRDRKSTVFMMTHRPRYARRAERSWHLCDGRIVGAEQAEGELP